MMSITRTMTMTVLAATISFSAMAETGQHSEEAAISSSQMPMMGGQQGGMPMMQGQQGGMPMMQQKQAMMQAHMVKMETHMANIEGLLKQLVELQKK